MSATGEQSLIDIPLESNEYSLRSTPDTIEDEVLLIASKASRMEKGNLVCRENCEVAEFIGQLDDYNALGIRAYRGLKDLLRGKPNAKKNRKR